LGRDPDRRQCDLALILNIGKVRHNHATSPSRHT